MAKPGRPRVGPRETVSVRLPEGEHDALAKASIASGEPMTAIIRRAIRRELSYLNNLRRVTPTST